MSKDKSKSINIVKMFYMGILCVRLEEINIKWFVQNCHLAKWNTVESSVEHHKPSFSIVTDKMVIM